MASLSAGLESNRLIGTAVGLVMAEHRLDRQIAFRYLTRLSQDSNVKLINVARNLIEAVEGQHRGD